MAEVILKNIKKIYPHQEPKKKKKGEPEKKTNLHPSIHLSHNVVAPRILNGSR